MTENGHGPLRTCLSCRKTVEKKQLVRYALDPTGSVIVDYRQKLPGRGVYTCFSADCLESIVKRKGFKRGFKQEHQPVSVEALTQALKVAIRERILNLIGMGRKAGLVTSGTNAVLDALKKPQPPRVVMVAGDISENIGDKIRHLAEKKECYFVQMFCKAEIGQLLGIDERSAIVFEKSRLADTLKFELLRFEQL